VLKSQFFLSLLNPPLHICLIPKSHFLIPFASLSEHQNTQHQRCPSQPRRINADVMAPGGPCVSGQFPRLLAPAKNLPHHLDALLFQSQLIPSKNMMLVTPIITLTNSNRNCFSLINTIRLNSTKPRISNPSTSFILFHQITPSITLKINEIHVISSLNNYHLAFPRSNSFQNAQNHKIEPNRLVSPGGNTSPPGSSSEKSRKGL